jgi:hypothetical protein
MEDKKEELKIEPGYEDHGTTTCEDRIKHYSYT